MKNMFYLKSKTLKIHPSFVTTGKMILKSTDEYSILKITKKNNTRLYFKHL